MRPFSAEAKLKLIIQVQKGEKVAKVCRKAGISRKTFYCWLKKYKSVKPNVVRFKLRDKRFKKIFSIRTLQKEERLLFINKALYKEAPISKLCQHAGISRK